MSSHTAHPSPESPEHTAIDAGLVWVSDADPGFARQRAGKGFAYRLPDGQPVRDAATLQRIRALAVPPAYTEVWICMRGNGHLQATGRDARQRKQYRYHAHWQLARGEGKFDRIVAFAQALPKLRRRLRADLKLRGLPRDKVLAIVVSVMADTLVRIGNDQYARSNKSYGLTTLRNRHVAFLRGGRARLAFNGKGGQQQDVELGDARMVKLVRACQELPGQALFQYRDDDGTLQPVDSGEINDYLRAAMGEDFTAKDFRTWGATLQAFRLFAATPLPTPAHGETPSESALAAAQNEVVKAVAAILGNTPAVCRKAYIDPAVFTGWRDATLVAAASGARGARQWEQAALKFLKRAHRNAKITARKSRSWSKSLPR
ncbi:MAG: DNA topoisomerase IB [Luteimonas sp.]